MFDLLDRPLHWIPVKWPILKPPVEEGDISTPGEAEVELQVEIVDRAEVMALFPNFFADDEVDKVKPDPERELEIFNRLVRDWRKIKSSGKVVEMNDANVKLLLSVPMFGAAFANAYLTAIGGSVAIREGNSDASGPDGREAAPASKKQNRS